MAHKTVPDSIFIGNAGAFLVPQIVNEMRFLWTPSAQFELGIDGTIEIVNPDTSQGTGNIIKVQIKTTAQPWPEESNESFSLPVRQQDLDYWLNGNTPVILICCKADTKEAYWKPVKEYFAALERRHERKIRFLKSKDQFSAGCREALINLAVPRDSGLYLPAIPKEETIYSNLVPISFFPKKIFHSSTDCADDRDAWYRLRTLVEHPAGEWSVNAKRLYSFHDLTEFPWNKVCDRGDVETLDSVEWAFSSDSNDRRQFVRLLNRCLSAKLAALRIRFRKDRQCYYFQPDGTEEAPSVRIVKELSISRTVAKTVVMCRFSKTKPGHISYWRHLAFIPHFVLIENQWYLEITPTYIFTRDGIRISKYSDENLSGIKRIEKNNAVLRNVLTWANFLQPKDDWFASHYEMLKFGPLTKLGLDHGIADEDWLGQADDEDADELRKDLSLGQEMLL